MNKIDTIKRKREYLILVHTTLSWNKRKIRYDCSSIVKGSLSQKTVMETIPNTVTTEKSEDTTVVV